MMVDQMVDQMEKKRAVKKGIYWVELSVVQWEVQRVGQLVEKLGNHIGITR